MSHVYCISTATSAFSNISKFLLDRKGQKLVDIKKPSMQI